MNERIKELAEQAGIVFWEMSGDVDWRQANRENLEKFAELIVRECMNLVKDCYSEAKSGKSQYQTVCASTIIEDYFGVEE